MSLELHAGYLLMVLLGITVCLSFPLTRGFAVGHERRRYWLLQLITLFGALLGAKFAVLLGDALWPLRPFPGWEVLLYSGRSIVGALMFGFLFAELAKPMLRYRLPPNDRFALILPLSIGIGRVGCLLAGCCLGLPHEGGLALTDATGLARFPAVPLEIAFHTGAAAGLVWLYRRGVLRGRLFALYMIGYGAFRFLSEYLRATEKAFAGHSAYQWLALLLLLCGLCSLWWRSTRHAPAIASTT